MSWNCPSSEWLRGGRIFRVDLSLPAVNKGLLNSVPMGMASRSGCRGGTVFVATVWPIVPSCAGMVILVKSLHHGTSVPKVVREDAVGTILHSLTL